MRRTLLPLLAACLLGAALPATAGPGEDAPLVFAPAGLSTDRFAPVTTPERVDVRAQDGVQLHARVYRPDTTSDPSWRSPVVLVHSPYYDGLLLGDDQRSLDVVTRFTPKGYTVVLSDVRGTGNSGGCASQDGADQAEDFATLVEHFAAQPWSNGRVAGYGKSYDAETQHAGAVLAPEGLVTMVSIAGISSLYDVAYFDGVPLRANGAASAAAYELYDVDVPGDPAYADRRLQRHTCQPENFVNGADPRGDMTPYWAERDFRRKVQRVVASTLYVMGLNDPTVTSIAIDGWFDALGTRKKAVFGQWGHNYPYDAAAAVARDDWYETVHAWLDAELLGLDTGVDAWPAVQVQAEAGDWRASTSFDALGTTTPVALGAGGVLGGEGAPAASFREDRSVTWTGGPLADPLHLSGQVHLDLVAALDRPDGHLAMTLQEVRANGTTRTLTRGYLSATHRDGLAAPVLVPMGADVAYRLRSYPFDRTVAAGSSLRLVLAGYDGSTTPAGTLFTASVAAGTLELPVVTRPCGIDVRTRTEVDAAPCPSGVLGD